MYETKKQPRKALQVSQQPSLTLLSRPVPHLTICFAQCSAQAQAYHLEVQAESS